MIKRRWNYYWIVTFIIIIVAGIWLWHSHYKLNGSLSKDEAMLDHKEIEEQLRAKDKQLEFYSFKVNELIKELNQVEQNNNPNVGGEKMELEDKLVWDSLESVEYKRIIEEYSKYYGYIDEDYIPKTETLEALRYKVEESIAEGYNLLPKYYGWTNVLMSLDTKEFEELNALYKEHFGDVIPTEEINGTMEQLIDVVNRSIALNKNLLPEYYHWHHD